MVVYLEGREEKLKSHVLNVSCLKYVYIVKLTHFIYVCKHENQNKIKY